MNLKNYRHFSRRFDVASRYFQVRNKILLYDYIADETLKFININGYHLLFYRSIVGLTNFLVLDFTSLA